MSTSEPATGGQPRPDKPKPTCVLFDLDGVLRLFDPDGPVQAEKRHGLPAGSLLATATEHELMDRLTTGRITRAEWADEVGRRVGSIEAAREWTADTGTPDEEMLELADELRAAGIVVAILTNGTDTVRAELAETGIDQRVDHIFNSADIGVAKPDPACFRYVCDALAISGEQIFFTDDSASKLAGAREVGMTAHLFEGITVLRDELVALGLVEAEADGT